MRVGDLVRGTKAAGVPNMWFVIVRVRTLDNSRNLVAPRAALIWYGGNRRKWPASRWSERGIDPSHVKPVAIDEAPDEVVTALMRWNMRS